MPPVELWSVRLEAPSAGMERLFAVLSSDEQVRARRFATEILRTRYTVARAALRILLGRHLGREPESLSFEYGSAGKPSLPDVSFNLSHSGDLAVYAIADAGLELGIDVEELRPLRDMHGLARRFFAPGEAATLAALPDAQQTAGFFRCWTRKEAYLKALGDGIGAALDRFEVTLHPDQAPALVHIDGDRAAAAEWTVHHFEPSDGYLAALVHRGPASPGEWHSRTADDVGRMLPHS